MDLNKLRDEAYSIAKANGWHEEKHSNEHMLMLIITEISEAVQADRKGHHANVEKFIENMADKDNVNDLWFLLTFSQNIKNTVEDELADVVIRCLDLAALRGIDFRHADMLLSEDTREVQVSFPELMYLACEEITYHGYDLAEKLNALVAGIIAYCKQKGIDLDFFIRTKMKYNRLRGYKHGGKKY